MRRIILFLSIAMLFACSNKQGGNGSEAASNAEIENALIELASNQIKSTLADPDSYKAGNFIFETLLPNEEVISEFPFVVDSVYMTTKTFSVWGSDTVYNGRFYVYHIYSGIDEFGENSTKMVKLEFDTHLQYQGMSEISDRNLLDAKQKWSEGGYAVDDLVMPEI